MKGPYVACFLLVFIVCLTTSQITFSRTWMRGKHPEDEGLVADGDNFLRAAKAAVAIQADDPIKPYSRFTKSDINLSTGVLEDILRKLRSSYFNRYKEVVVPLSIE